MKHTKIKKKKAKTKLTYNDVKSNTASCLSANQLSSVKHKQRLFIVPKTGFSFYHSLLGNCVCVNL